MDIQSRTREGVTILEPKGKITIGEGDIALRKAITEALDGGATQIVLNMKSTKRLDSSGIAELVASRGNAKSRGAEIKLSNLPRKVENVLNITQIFSIFDVLDDEDAAVASFESG